MNKIVLYLMTIGIVVTTYNILEHNQPLLNYIFLILIGIYYFYHEIWGKNNALQYS